MSDTGWVQSEMIVDSVLRAGLAQVRQAFGDNTIDDLLDRVYHGEADTQAAMKTWLSTHDPVIYHGYALPTDEFPCLCIVVNSERQVQQYNGDL
ncbi:MAG TPA: hypothetical protein VMT89_04535, partial [Candidatus Acidoferrales bacterium]|nr:hypothetical protein [Candidatus Acidoferrales bacterium]